MYPTPARGLPHLNFHESFGIVRQCSTALAISRSSVRRVGSSGRSQLRCSIVQSTGARRFRLHSAYPGPTANVTTYDAPSRCLC